MWSKVQRTHRKNLQQTAMRTALAESYAHFLREQVAPPPEHVRQALAASPLPVQLFPALADIKLLMQRGYQAAETGYTLTKDGEIRVAVLTDMPGVSPQMWDFWFGWHGCSNARYQLWHPQAHRSAHWADGKKDHGYIGRTSVIAEYIGNSLEKAHISFISPTALGFSEADIAKPNDCLFICARIGYARLPLNFGWLLHQVRATEQGSEMRSRFFIGGQHIAFRSGHLLAKLGSDITRKLARPSQQRAADLLTHCSEEMNHLAAILPEIYRTYA